VAAAVQVGAVVVEGVGMAAAVEALVEAVAVLEVAVLEVAVLEVVVVAATRQPTARATARVA